MVIADDDRIDGRYLEVHQGILSLLALQAPVAGDLRLVAALLHVIKHVERMGDQCVNMAKLVPLAGHQPPADAAMLEHIQRMGEQARQQVVQCGQAFARRDVELAQDLVRQDDEIDALNREVFHIALEIGDDADRREWAMHMMLVARCIERIGDNAVDIGEQTAFVVTGLFREFEDASHPELAPPSRLICACIDIGSNTTRLLVADAGEGSCASWSPSARSRASARACGTARHDPAGEDRGDRRGGPHAGHRGARGGRRADRGRGHRRDPAGRATATSWRRRGARPAAWS